MQPYAIGDIVRIIDESEDSINLVGRVSRLDPPAAHDGEQACYFLIFEGQDQECDHHFTYFQLELLG